MASGNNDNKGRIRIYHTYDDGIASDYAIASGSVPVNYDSDKDN